MTQRQRLRFWLFLAVAAGWMVLGLLNDSDVLWDRVLQFGLAIAWAGWALHTLWSARRRDDAH